MAISHLILMVLMISFLQSHSSRAESYREMEVGVILDMGSMAGKIVHSCISMAVSEFYKVNPHYTTRIRLRTTDTRGQPLRALSAALDLLENTKVEAIIGPESMVEVKFFEVMIETAKVPILSFSTSPSSNSHPHLFQITQDETMQFKAIAAMAESYKFNNIVLICEDTTNGREMAAYTVEKFQEKHIDITYLSLVSPSANHEQVIEELQKLQNMQKTTFIVHVSESLASRIFFNAKEVGMMGEGYIWILTSKASNFLDFMDVEAFRSMQGVVGFKSYVPPSKELRDFMLKWRKKHYDMNSFMEFKYPNAHGIWAYDALHALAMAFERTQVVTPLMGTLSLQDHMLRIKFHGLGGEFKWNNGRISSKVLEIVNVIGKSERTIGFWTNSEEFFTKDIKKMNSSLSNGLDTIIWPGMTTMIPKRKRLLMNIKKLRILVPDNPGFKNLIQLTVDSRTNLTTVGGFCGDVFNAAFNTLTYGATIEFNKFSFKPGESYNNLIDKLHLEDFDALVGDVTITANRSLYVDFTLPFSDQGIGTLARNANKSMWIFLDPLSTDLWITSGIFFLLLGFVIWFIKHRTNTEFQGSARQQFGTTLWFAMSTLVYAHREKLQSNLSRFVVIVWVFVVLVLTSSYTATLSSLLTVEQIRSQGRSIGFLRLSPIGGTTIDNFNFVDGTFEKLYSPDDYIKALSSGRIGAIIDELPYIKSVIAMSSDFSIIAIEPTTNGFGFAFKKGSPLAIEMSTEIAKLREDGTLKALEDKWLKRQSALMSKDYTPMPRILNLNEFRGLFLISGVSMALALFISIFYFLHNKLHAKNKVCCMMYILCKVAKVHVEPNGIELPK